MILTDVNVLIYAHREDTVDHDRYRHWLEAALASPEAFGIVELVLSGFLRVTTNPKIFSAPTPLDVALTFVEAIRASPNGVRISPGVRHWSIFTQLCRETGATGNLVPDAFLAALAIESGSEWITTDRDFRQFPGLKWRHPLQPTETQRR
jgi:uncharacterized protein